MLAARVSLVASSADGRAGARPGADPGDLDRGRGAVDRINPGVAHYTGQAELAAAIQEGLEASKRGDEDTATARLGRAVALAHQAGNEDTARLLAKVVDVVDEATGTVRLKKKVERRRRDGARHQVDQDGPGQEGIAMATCPSGHESASDDFCDVCGVADRRRAVLTHVRRGGPRSAPAQAPAGVSPPKAPARVAAPAGRPVLRVVRLRLQRRPPGRAASRSFPADRTAPASRAASRTAPADGTAPASRTAPARPVGAGQRRRLDRRGDGRPRVLRQRPGVRAAPTPPRSGSPATARNGCSG